MHDVTDPLHIYERTIDDQHPDSLSLIAGFIKPGESVLDLGMGAGALGKHLSKKQDITIDGVTYNAAEAEIARDYYRRISVADLDAADITEMFSAEQYDCVVCADVLEHLKSPQHVLKACKNLLVAGGKLLVSVPNAGYCGLLAELIQGDFRYRTEGLLDETHLRFFTRKSLLRFFNEQGWSVIATSSVQRALPESEFRAAFDAFPPAVARHLLGIPDALTYQFIWELQPTRSMLPVHEGVVVNDSSSVGATESASALFSAQLYLGTSESLHESSKLTCPGTIGKGYQTLAFNVPPSGTPYTRLRLDPADRPGFMRIYNLSLELPNKKTVWEWRIGEQPLDNLANAPHHQIAFHTAYEPCLSALLVLYGDDPWVELPLNSDALEAVSLRGASLTAVVGWPMSADYVEAANLVQETWAEHQKTVASYQSQLGLVTSELNSKTTELMAVSQLQQSLQSDLEHFRQMGHTAQEEKQKLLAEMRLLQRDRDLHQRNFTQISEHLRGIEQSSIFKATRPLVHAKMRIDRLMSKDVGVHNVSQPSTLRHSLALPKAPVDIIIPVYRGLEDTRMSVSSVLSALYNTAWRLIIINDCSPEPEVTAWLRQVAKDDPRITLIENTENLGFVGTVNVGMSLNPNSDVLLLNSDAEVANDWLDRMQRAAYSEPQIGTVTPFSNNATIFSYPSFCKPNEMPSGYDTAKLDDLFAIHLKGQTLEVPTAVGFCMYIRRQCLQEVGYFDIENFGKGYGEENDFCVRAESVGWKHLHALDTFVRHAGGVSFGDSKSQRELQAMETLRRLHPTYERVVHNFVQRDPAASPRMVIDIARITAGDRPVILNVIHDREGGTLRHTKELSAHLSESAIFLSISHVAGGSLVTLEGKDEAFALYFALPAEHPHMLAALRQLQVVHVHYHHMLGHPADIVNLPAQLKVTYDFTTHDYYSYCPQISLTDHTDRYCGEQGLGQCRTCVARDPAPDREGIETWRNRNADLLNHARYVIAPSEDTAERMRRFVPAANVQVVFHASLSNKKQGVNDVPFIQPMANNRPLKIAVLGALSKIKGADTLEEVAILAAESNTQVEFHLLGYAYRSLRTQPKAGLTVHGEYEDKDLLGLLAWLKPDLIWFPALWPETYSYTLSASLDSGLPIVAPNLGAFPERLEGRRWTWLRDWQSSPQQWLAFFSQIRQNNFIPQTEPPPVCAPLGLRERKDSALDPALNYRDDYLRNFPQSIKLEPLQLMELQQFLLPFKDQDSRDRAASAVVKNSVLRSLARLRLHPLFSPLARAVPMHVQRRIKSWLVK